MKNGSPYLSGKFRRLKVGLTTFSEGETSLVIEGNIGIGTTNPRGYNSVAYNNSLLAVGIVTAKEYFGDGSYLTGITAQLPDNLVGTALSISGIASVGAAITMYGATGIISATKFFGDGSQLSGVTAELPDNLVGTSLSISGIASVGAAITMYGSTGIISATKFFGDGSSLSGVTAELPDNLVGTSLSISGISTLGNDFLITPTSSGIGVTVGSTGIATYYGDGQYLTGVTAELPDNLVGTALSISGIASVGAAITMYGSTGIISATKFFGEFIGDGSEISGITAELPDNLVGTSLSISGISTLGNDFLITPTSSGIGVTVGATGIVTYYGDGQYLTGILADLPDNLVGTALSISGIASASAFADFDYLQAPFGSTTTFTVTVASKSGHRYQGQGSGNAYLINGVQAPVLTLTPGRTYRFTNDNTGSHPLKFYYEADKTTEYTTGVDFQNSYTDITISDTTPNVLHYQCTNHGYMGNAIITNSNVVDSPYPATLREGLNVTGIASVGTAITMYGATGIISATQFIGDGSKLTNISPTLTGVSTGVGTFIAVAGVSTNVDSFAYASLDYKIAEYSLHLMNGADIQSQRLLVMQDNTTAYSNEFAIMSSSDLLVSIGVTISGSNVLVQVTPETGISGLTTYRWRREVQE